MVYLCSQLVSSNSLVFILQPSRCKTCTLFYGVSGYSRSKLAVVTKVISLSKYKSTQNMWIALFCLLFVTSLHLIILHQTKTQMFYLCNNCQFPLQAYCRCFVSFLNKSANQWKENSCCRANHQKQEPSLAGTLKELLRKQLAWWFK